MKLRSVGIIVTTTCMALCSAIGQDNGSTAILPFRDGRVSSEVAYLDMDGRDFVGTISDLLATQLTNRGNRVKDTASLSKILREKNLDAADPRNELNLQRAVKLGSLMGVDTVIFGEITYLDPSPHLSLLTFHPEPVIRISAQVLDVATGQVLTSSAAAGTLLRSDLLARESADDERTLIEMALRRAITILADDLSKGLALAHSPGVAEVRGERLVLSVGSNRFLKVGDILTLVRPKQSLPGHEGNSQVEEEDEEIGKITVTQVGPGSAIGRYSGLRDAKVGDRIKWEGASLAEEPPHRYQGGTPSPSRPKSQENESSATNQRDGLPPGQSSPAKLPDSAANGSSSQSPNRTGKGAVGTKDLSDVGAQSSAVDEYALGYQLAAWRDSLKTGAVEYRVPDVMDVTVPATVTVYIHGFGDQQSRTLSGATGYGLLKVSSHMKVELFAPMHPGEFNLSPTLGDPIQLIPNDGYASWMWEVTPTAAASSEVLQIRISLVHEPSNLILAEKTFNVTVRLQKLSVIISHSFWKNPLAWFEYVLPGGKGWSAIAAIGASLGGIGGLLGWRRKRAKKRPPNVEGHPA